MAGGTNKRQRTKQCLVRLTSDEYACVAEKADRAGLPTAAFLRAAALGEAGPRAQRRVPADRQALLRILGQLGKIGSNINQIAKRLNSGGPADLPLLQEALGAYLEMRGAIYAALGLDAKGNAATPSPSDPGSSHGHQRRQPRGP